MNNKSAIILALGMIIAALVFGTFFKQSRKSDRWVTVKGLSEREVIADKAWWSINAQYNSQSFTEIQASIENHEKLVRNFLITQGFSEKEIKVENISVNQNTYSGARYPFTLDMRISVTSNDIDKITTASSKVASLIDKGVFLSGDKWATGPKYYFTRFSDIKTEMLAEATKEARKAADEFAKNSNSYVGEIRKANQGIFQILPGNRTNENAEFFPEKIIRVVSTVDFFLD